MKQFLMATLWVHSYCRQKRTVREKGERKAGRRGHHSSLKVPLFLAPLSILRNHLYHCLLQGVNSPNNGAGWPDYPNLPFPKKVSEKHFPQMKTLWWHTGWWEPMNKRSPQLWVTQANSSWPVFINYFSEKTIRTEI